MFAIIMSFASLRATLGTDNCVCLYEREKRKNLVCLPRCGNDVVSRRRTGKNESAMCSQRLHIVDVSASKYKFTFVSSNIDTK